MAVYKVPQDVEAEDKLLGPFSPKQFLFIIGFMFFAWLTFTLFTASPFLALITLPMVVIFGVLGFWPRRDQPVEVYLAALLRFWFKPRKRLWNQEGMMKHVIITVPKKIEHHYTDGLSRMEVQSRLKNLADSLDSRGWTARNVEVADVQSSLAAARMPGQTDRLIMPAIQNEKTPIDIHVADDILDVQNNRIAQNLDQLATNSTQRVRQQAIERMNDPDYNPYPNMQQHVINPIDPQHQIRKDGTHESQLPVDERAAPQQPQNQNPPQENPQPDQNISPMTEGPSTAILNLAQNSDLNIETIARQAQRAQQEGESLHDDDTIELH